jgi:hypothetical protein
MTIAGFGVKETEGNMGGIRVSCSFENTGDISIGTHACISSVVD